MDSTYEIVKELIDFNSEGVDTYNHNGSTWLIFTDQKKWVIELTKEKTLWYNYYFFTGVFKYLSLDVVENQHYITKWVEDTIINPVKHTSHFHWNNDSSVEDTIENGVKDIQEGLGIQDLTVEDTFEYCGRKWNKVNDTIQNGVKDTRKQEVPSIQIIEDTIQNGVKSTSLSQSNLSATVEDTIQNGVKSTKGEYYKEIQKVEYAIQNGVKNTQRCSVISDRLVEDTIQNGVKHTATGNHIHIWYVEDTIQNGIKETELHKGVRPSAVENTIQNGVKKTKRSYEGSRKQRTKDTIENGVKSTFHNIWNRHEHIEDTLQNGVKHTQGSVFDNPTTVKDTIQNGVKYTVPMGKDKDSIVSNDFGMNQAIKNGIKGTYRFGFGNEAEIEDAIKNGVKKTYSDKIPHEYDWTEQFTEEIEGIIQNGVKHTEKSLQIDGSCVIEDVIKEGVKHTEYGDWLDGDERLDDIINNGVKETTPGGYLGFVEHKGKKIHQFETAKQLYYVEDVIESGIKKTEAAALFDEESKMDTVISNGIKETHDDVMPHTGRVDGVIKNGVKQCVPVHHTLYNPMDFSVEYRENHRIDDVASVLEKGIKEVQPLPAQDGNMDWGNYYHRQEDRTKPHTKYVDDVITNGIKETKPMDEWVNTEKILDGVIDKGIKS